MTTQTDTGAIAEGPEQCLVLIRTTERLHWGSMTSPSWIWLVQGGVEHIMAAVARLPGGRDVK